MIGVLLTMGWTGCREEPITWRTPLHDVIFLQDTLTWTQLVPDTLWTEGDEGLILNASGRQPLVPANDWIPPLDTAWTASFELPFIGGPIPVAPGAEIWGEDEDINFDIPDVDLRRVRLGGGVLQISAESTVQGPLELRYRIEGADFPEEVNGGNSEFIVQLTPDAPTTLWVPMEGVELDLVAENEQGWSRLLTSWDVGVPASAAEEVGLFGSDELILTVGLEGVEVAQVEGRFSQRLISMGDTLKVQDLGAIQSVDVQWSEIGIDLHLINTAGLDLLVQLDTLQRLESLTDGEALSLLDPALEASVWLPRATVVESTGMDNWAIAPGTATLSLGTGDGSLAAFLASAPAAFLFSGEAELNPLGDVSGGYDRVDLTRLPEVEWTVKAPLNLGPSQVVWVDTLAPVLPDGLAFDGTLNLSFESSLPVGALLEMSLIELPQVITWLHQGASENWNALNPVDLPPGSGSADAPSVTEAEWNLEPWHFDALRQGARLRVMLTCNTPEEGAQFYVEQRVVVRGHLEGDAIISVE
jgi:hypothetical protein